jgi:hypothetical protein
MGRVIKSFIRSSKNIEYSISKSFRLLRSVNHSAESSFSKKASTIPIVEVTGRGRPYVLSNREATLLGQLWEADSVVSRQVVMFDRFQVNGITFRVESDDFKSDHSAFMCRYWNDEVSGECWLYGRVLQVLKHTPDAEHTAKVIVKGRFYQLQSINEGGLERVRPVHWSVPYVFADNIYPVSLLIWPYYTSHSLDSRHASDCVVINRRPV